MPCCLLIIAGLALGLHRLDQYASAMTRVSANVSAKAGDFASASSDAQTQKAPQCRAFQDGRGGFRTCDLSRVKDDAADGEKPDNPRSDGG